MVPPQIGVGHLTRYGFARVATKPAHAVAYRQKLRTLGDIMTDAAVKAPWHLWLIGVIAVLFNAIGVFDFVMSMTRGATYLASAGMTPEQVAHYQGLPGWMTAVWAIGVWGAFLASILLLLRRRVAFAVFVLSLAAFLISLIYTYILTDGGAIMGPQMALTSAVIAILLLCFSWYSHAMGKRGVLR